MISYINKVMRSIMALTDCKPLVHDSQVLVSSNEPCSSTLYFSQPHSNILSLLSQALLTTCSEVGRRHLLSNRVGIDLSCCRFCTLLAQTNSLVITHRTKSELPRPQLDSEGLILPGAECLLRAEPSSARQSG